MNDLTLYVTLLVVSVGLTFLVGRLLVVAGEPFLKEVFHEPKVTHSVNLLLSVLFHLVTLGVLVIISAVPMTLDTPLQTFVVRLGVVLLVLGLAYGISMLVLIRIRAQRRADEIAEQVQQQLALRAGHNHGYLPETAPPVTTHPVSPTDL